MKRNLKLPALKQYEEKIYSCMRCGFCRSTCPILLKRDMEETFSPRGRILLIRGLMSNELDPSTRLVEKIYSCTTCRHCYSTCPPRLEIDRIVEATRNQLVKLGVAPPKAHRAITSKIESENNPFGEPKNARARWLESEESVLPEKAEVLYWAGCMASYRTQATARATVRILKHAGVNFTILGKEEGCCGSFLLRTGQRDVVENKYAKVNVAKIADRGAKTVVTACAGCFRTFHDEYPEMLGTLPFEVLHVSQYLEGLVKARRIGFSKELTMKVTYHDPCHLGRHLSIYEPPRNVMNAIPGIVFSEMVKSHEESRCCGAGGGFRSAFPELSVLVAMDRLKLDVLPTSVDAVVTACPFCVKNFEDAVKRGGMRLQVLDLPELVWKAMGIDRSLPSVA